MGFYVFIIEGADNCIQDWPSMLKAHVFGIPEIKKNLPNGGNSRPQNIPFGRLPMSLQCRARYVGCFYTYKLSNKLVIPKHFFKGSLIFWLAIVPRGSITLIILAFYTVAFLR